VLKVSICLPQIGPQVRNAKTVDGAKLFQPSIGIRVKKSACDAEVPPRFITIAKLSLALRHAFVKKRSEVRISRARRQRSNLSQECAKVSNWLALCNHSERHQQRKCGALDIARFL
jgi:hypothetical protein